MEVDFKSIHGKRVLIIDSEVDFCALMRVYFRRKNCQVFIAHSFVDGLTSVSRYLPEVIIIDKGLSESRDQIVNTILGASLDVELIDSGREVLYARRGDS